MGSDGWVQIFSRSRTRRQQRAAMDKYMINHCIQSLLIKTCLKIKDLWHLAMIEYWMANHDQLVFDWLLTIIIILVSFGAGLLKPPLESCQHGNITCPLAGDVAAAQTPARLVPKCQHSTGWISMCVWYACSCVFFWPDNSDGSWWSWSLASCHHVCQIIYIHICMFGPFLQASSLCF